MLPQYYHHPQPKVKVNKDEESILSSFYEERKSRSANQKYHNLLKKNISFFHPEHLECGGEQPLEGRREEDNIGSRSRTRIASQSPLPPHPHAHLHQPKEIPISKQRSSQKLQLPAPQVVSPRQSDEEYYHNLKNQLNKRININNYLNHFPQKGIQKDSQNNKEVLSEMDANRSSKTLKNSKKYQEGDSIFNQSSFKMQDQTQRQPFQSRMSLGKENRGTQQSRRLSLKGSSCFKVTNNNNLTERSQPQCHIFDSAKSKKSNRSHSNGKISHSKENHREESEQEYVEPDFVLKRSYEPTYNYLSKDELSSLHQNSHPLHFQSQPIKNTPLNYSYITPEEQSSYKSRIKELEAKVNSLQDTRKKQQKFIGSIQKMRKLMLNTPRQQDCSLKELWRWIKQLPRK